MGPHTEGRAWGQIVTRPESLIRDPDRAFADYVDPTRPGQESEFLSVWLQVVNTRQADEDPLDEFVIFTKRWTPSSDYYRETAPQQRAEQTAGWV
jgi:hypothetical protein